jgi:hypothetical protein
MFSSFMDAYCQFQGERVGAFGCDTALQTGEVAALIPSDLTFPAAL